MWLGKNEKYEYTKYEWSARLLYIQRQIKGVHVNNIESKMVNINATSMDKRESKSVHEVNTSKIKYTEDEELSLLIIEKLT